MKGTGMAFVIAGVLFIASGLAGRRAFIGVGAAFFVIGPALQARHKREGGSQ